MGDNVRQVATMTAENAVLILNRLEQVKEIRYVIFCPSQCQMKKNALQIIIRIVHRNPDIIVIRLCDHSHLLLPPKHTFI